MKPSVALVAVVLVLIALMTMPVNATPASGGRTPEVSGASSGPATPAWGADTWQEFQHDAWNTGSSTDTAVGSNLNWNASIGPFADGANTPTVGSPAAGQGNVYLPEGDSVDAYNATTGALAWKSALTPSGGAPVVVDTPLLWRGWIFVAEDQGALGGGGGACGGPMCGSLYILNATTGAIALDVPSGTDGYLGEATPNSIVPLVGPAFTGDVGIGIVNFYGYFQTFTWNGVALANVGGNQAVRAAGTRTTSSPAIAWVPGEGWGAYYLDAGHNTITGTALSDGAALPLLANYPVGPGIGNGVNLDFQADTSGSIAIANLTTRGLTTPIAFFGDDHAAGANSNLVAFNLSAATEIADGVLVSPGGGLNAGVLSTPAIYSINASAEGVVLTDLNGTVSNWVFYDNPNGGDSSLTMTWLDHTTGPSQSSAAIAGGTDAYIANSLGQVTDLSLATGTPVWNTTVSQAVRANLALGYSRLYVASSPVGGVLKGNLTAFGPAPEHLLSAVATATPSPIASGGTSMVVVQVGWKASRGLGSGPASTAMVNFSATPAGTWQAASVAANANGYAYDNWTAPASSPVWYNATVNVAAWAPYNISTAATTAIEVMPGSSSAPSPMAIAVSPPISPGLQAGDTQVLTFTASSGGTPLVGATLTLWLNGPGSLTNPGPLTTGAGGQATDTYTAPASIPSATAAVLTVNSTDVGYTPASGSAALELVPTSSPGGSSVYPWSATASPNTLTVMGGATAEVAVSFENSTTGTGVPVAGVTVTGSAAGSASGSLQSATATTNGLGDADFNFTATDVPGAVLLTFTASQGKAGASAAASVSVAVTSPSTAYPWAASASPANVAIWGGNTTTVSVTFLNVTGDAKAPIAGLTVTASLQGTASGSFASSTATTNAQGTASFTFDATKVPGAVLATFSGSQGVASASASVSISVFNPSTSTTTPTQPTTTPSNTLGGLTQAEWEVLLLVLLIVGLVIGLLVGRRSGSGPETMASTVPSSGGEGSSKEATASSPSPKVDSDGMVAATGASAAVSASTASTSPKEEVPSSSTPATEDTTPISVEEPEEESSSGGAVDNDKLAAGLSSALAASGADEEEKTGESEPESTTSPAEGSDAPADAGGESTDAASPEPSEPVEVEPEPEEPPKPRRKRSSS